MERPEKEELTWGEETLIYVDDLESQIKEREENDRELLTKFAIYIFNNMPKPPDTPAWKVDQFYNLKTN